ncbi:type II secretion system F family protein [Halanaerobium congolense]|uniref:Type IV pilus assembly protein PilC n=1 Tax=Halanaerobium congolense TaxID=54121 RepID=A0A1G6HXE0_9FIRM|nr:type II secretion system F family protein [Halanaerobium congolense]PUU88409.1 MAG: type IV pilus assembly protein PilC [Halanaerobium sp.]SDB98505.1 type IV pilus assembly protein PilC [Halanaerobium congolense]
MAIEYQYKAKNKEGDLISGTIEAENKSVIARQLRDKGYYITEISEKRKALDVGEFLKMHKKVKLKNLAVFSQQFAAMIDAGISLVDSLNILVDQTEHRRLREVILKVRDDVETGVSLADAMAKHPAVFPQLYIQLVKAGESGGVLDRILNKLADHYDRQDELNSMVRSALYYPAVILTVGIIVVIFLVTQVVPQFVTMFQDFGSELPLPTRMLLAISTFMQSYWWALLLAFIIVLFILGRFRGTPAGKEKTDSWILKMPVIGPMMRKVYISRFSSTLAILVESGVDLLTALAIVEDVVGNKVYGEILTKARVRVREGSNLSDPLQESGEFPAMVVQMISVGEETGAIGTMLNKVSTFYDRQVEASVDGAISLIEPVMIVLLAVMVGFVAISIVTPMFDMFQQF